MSQGFEDRSADVPPVDVPPVDVDISKSLTPPTQDDKQWGMFAHLGGLVGGFVLPMVGWFLVPLIIWMVKKDTSRFVDDQAKEALNFQITMFIGGLIATAITVATCFIGFPILFVPFIVELIYSIQAAVAANRGEWYRYPSWVLRLVK